MIACVGATYESNVNAAPSGYNNGLGPAVAVQPRMQAADAPLGAGGVRMESSEPHGMSALPPSNPAAASTGATAATSMFDPSNGTGAPLLSIGSGTSSMPNPVLRAPSLGSFSMGLQGTNASL